MAAGARAPAATRSRSTASATSSRDARAGRRTRTWAAAGESPEFVGLDPAQTVRALDAGRRVLKLAGIEPRGFVAPAYAYTRQLRESLRDALRLVGRSVGTALDARWARRARLCGPPIGLAAAGPLRRAASPVLLRAASRFAGPMLRVDVHPRDLASASHMLALEHVIAPRASAPASASPTTTSPARPEP